MPLSIIFPTDGVPMMHLPESPDGQRRIVEAWPGSVTCDDGPDGLKPTVFGYVLAVSGGLPDGKFGCLIVVPIDRVEEMRAKYAPLMERQRRYHEREKRRREQGVGR